MAELDGTPIVTRHPPVLTPPDNLKRVVQTLFNVLVQSYDYQGTQTSAALAHELTALNGQLHALAAAAKYSAAASASASGPSAAASLPPEVIAYVEDGRNPDIYTREFVELTQKNNQQLRGRVLAFARFRHILAAQIGSAVPELRGPVRRVLERTALGPAPAPSPAEPPSQSQTVVDSATQPSSQAVAVKAGDAASQSRAPHPRQPT